LRLKKAATMLVVALCKAALLLSTLEASPLALGAGGEPSECEAIDLASLTAPDGSVSRILRRRTPACSLPAKFREKSLRAACRAPSPSLAGHLLPDGLRAPLRC
jgi:hypothetical protein